MYRYECGLIPCLHVLLVNTPLRHLKLRTVHCTHSQGKDISGCWCQNVLLSFKSIDRNQSAVNRRVHNETKQLP